MSLIILFFLSLGFRTFDGRFFYNDVLWLAYWQKSSAQNCKHLFFNLNLENFNCFLRKLSLLYFFGIKEGNTLMRFSKEA